MNNITYAVSVDVNNPIIPYNVYVASVLDSNVRYLEITLYQNGNVIALSNEATATASLVTDDVLVDDSVECTISNNIITVPLEDLQRHGNLDVQVTVTEGEKVLAIPFPIQVRVTPNIAENAQIDEDSLGSYAEVVQEIAAARKGYDSLDERLNSIISGSGNVASVKDYGAKGDGETDDTKAIKQAIEENNLVIFPEGEYLTNGGVSVANLSDRTLWVRGAEVKFDGNGGSVFHFENCDNIDIVGGTYKGMNKAKFGLNFFDSKNVSLDGVSVQNVGNSYIVGASGINFVGDCSNSKLIDASVNGVTSGIPDATGYIFAHGIGFIRSGVSGRYSQNVEINHPVIKNVGYVNGGNYVDAEPVTVEGSEVIHYEVGGVTCNPDIMDGSHARIDGDGIFIVQSKGVGGVHDGAESFFSIKNVDIKSCSKRALKIVARCVDVDGGEIDVDTWSAAVEVQRVRNNSLRNLNISDTAYTPVTINGGDGPMVIENCRITGGGMSSSGSGGIVLGAKSTGLVEGSEIVHIKNCVFDNTRYPIYAAINSAAAGKTDCEELVIKDCLIKHFYGDAAVKLEAGRYQRLGKLTIENVSFAYGTSTATVFFNNNNFYNQSIPLNSRLFNFFSPEKIVKVMCDNLSDDFQKIFESYNLTTPNQIFEMPLQPNVFFENPDEQVKLTSGDYDSDGGSEFRASAVGNTVLLSETSGETYAKDQRVVVPLESPITVSPGERLFLTICNSHPRTSSVNDLTVNFFTNLGATEGALSVHDENYGIAAGYTAYVKKRAYKLSLDQSLTLQTMVIRVNAATTITEGTEITVSLKTEKELKEIYTKAEVDALDEAKADKADTNAQFERLIAVLQSKAGKAETLEGYGINDAYTKAETDSLVSANAKSAYEIAVEHGYQGTEEQWLDSLKGDKGDKGDPGQDYVLTNQDKSDIADIVLGELPTTEGVLYGN